MPSPTGDYIDPTSETAGSPQASHGTDEGFFPPSNLIGVYSVGSGRVMLSAYGETMRWSYPVSPDGARGFQDWLELDKVQFPGQGDITAFVEYADHLFVFSRNRCWRLYGDSPPKWFKVVVSETVGCGSPYLLAETTQGLVWFDDGTRTLWHADLDGRLVDVWADRVRLPGDAVGRAVGVLDDTVYVSVSYLSLIHI